MKRIGVRATGVIFLAALAALCSCATISTFSQTAYEQCTSLKVDSLDLMDHATAPFESHRTEAEALMVRVDKAYEFARGRPKNTITTRQWEILKDPSGHLLGGFMKRWREKSTLSADFVTEVKVNVSDAFDTIIQLESGKIRPGDLK